MKKNFIITIVLIALSFICIACSGDQEKREMKEKTKEEKNPEKNVTEKGYDALIGEKINISDDGTITLPTEEQVQEAAFSKDGNIKLFETSQAAILIENDTIIHAAEADSMSQPTVSEDGRFAVWYTNKDWEPAIYDFKNHKLDIVELTEEQDPYDIQAFDFPLIEKHGDTYFLMENMYMFGLAPFGALDLMSKEIYTELNEEDVDTLESLTPRAVVDNDTYHAYLGDVRMLLDPSGEASDVHELTSTDGNYEVYFNAERVEDSELFVRELYGIETFSGTIIDIPVEEAGIELDREAVKLHATLALIDDIKISDTGMLVLPMFEEIDGSDVYKMSIYSIDLTKENPELHLIEDKEVSTYPDNRPIVLLNSDNTGFYLSNVDGKMEYYSFKNNTCE